MSARHKAFCDTYPAYYADLRKYFPDFDYRAPVGDRNIICRMTTAGNQVGHQQRAVTNWWAIEKCDPFDPGLDIGSHRGITPFCIHVDRWYDNAHEHPIYGGVHPADVVCDATDLPMFPKETFPYIASNHSLEHMAANGDDGVVDLLSRWVSLLRRNGVLAMIVPDNNFWDVMGSDKDHKHAWGHADFRARVLDKLIARGGIQLVEYDTLDNNYSFNVVLQRTDGR